MKLSPIPPHLSATRENYTLAPCESCNGTRVLHPYKGVAYECSCRTGSEGIYNFSADLVPRQDITYSAGRLKEDFNDPKLTWDRLKCGACGGVAFEILATDGYETTAQCVVCKAYYVVHTG